MASEKLWDLILRAFMNITFYEVICFWKLIYILAKGLMQNENLWEKTNLFPSYTQPSPGR